MAKMMRLGLVVILGIGFASSGLGLTTTATVSGNWSSGGIWDNGLPGAGDDAVIAAGAVVTLSASSPALNSLTNNGGTLIFDGAGTVLSATTVDLNSGTVTHTAIDTDVSATIHSVHIACTDLDLDAAATIDVFAKGYRGAPACTMAGGQGPNGAPLPFSANGGGGGGNGGAGGVGQGGGGGITSGTAAMPSVPGGGGATTTGGGCVAGLAGGGVVRIVATGTVTIDGAVDARGALSGAATGWRGGGGAGGSIWIDALFLAGGGSLSARGGDSQLSAGGGGGGRIAIVVDDAAQTTAGLPGIAYDVSGGLHANAAGADGEAGTIYFSSDAAVPLVWTTDAQLYTPALALPSLNVASEISLQSSVSVDLGGNLDLTGSLDLGPVTGLTVGGSLAATGATLTTNSSISVSGSLALDDTQMLLASPAVGGGAGLTVTAGAMTLINGTSVEPASHVDDGSSVKFVLASLSVDGTSKIDANELGYLGGISTTTPGDEHGEGPGGGLGQYWGGGGGGYGGAGGRGHGGLGGPTYGSLTTPTEPGSGAGTVPGGGWQAGGAGGGVIWLEVSGAVLLDGTLTANGEYAVPQTGWRGGGGSGGAILVQAASLAGSGNLRARGGFTQHEGGGGGGGRIAIQVDSPTQAGVTQPTLSIDAAPGIGQNSGQPGTEGTVWVSDPSILPETWLGGAQIHSPAWAPASLTVNGATVRLINPASQLDVAGNVNVSSGIFDAAAVPVTVAGNMAVSGSAVMANTDLVIAGNLTLSNSNLFSTSAAVGGGIGATITVGGAMTLSNGSTVWPASDPDDGSSVKYHASSLSIDGTSGFNADEAGFRGAAGDPEQFGLGPGGGGHLTASGNGAGGGGYGGKGGDGWDGPVNSPGGPVYGSAQFPDQPGSGGGTTNVPGGGKPGGDGGGLICIEVCGSAAIDGTLTARGGQLTQPSNWRAGGGSGGAVFVRADSISGGGSIIVDGGWGRLAGAGGGGGRVAIWAVSSSFSGSTSVAGGVGQHPSGGTFSPGDPGTVFSGALVDCDLIADQVLANLCGNNTATSFEEFYGDVAAAIVTEIGGSTVTACCSDAILATVTALVPAP